MAIWRGRVERERQRVGGEARGAVRSAHPQESAARHPVLACIGAAHRRDAQLSP